MVGEGLGPVTTRVRLGRVRVQNTTVQGDTGQCYRNGPRPTPPHPPEEGPAVRRGAGRQVAFVCSCSCRRHLVLPGGLPSED